MNELDAEAIKELTAIAVCQPWKKWRGPMLEYLCVDHGQPLRHIVYSMGPYIEHNIQWAMFP